MDFLADILLASAALCAAAYCVVLSRRLQKLSTLDGQVGGAIAVLSKQVDELTSALAKAQNGAGRVGATLIEQNRRAEQAIRKLELLLASLHDLPDSGRSEPARDRAVALDDDASPWPRDHLPARGAGPGTAEPGRRRLVRRNRLDGAET